MKFKTKSRDRLDDFIKKEFNKRGLNIYQCNSCKVYTSNRRKPEVCSLCGGESFKVIRER